MRPQTKKTAKTPLDDKIIIDLYWDRDERAIEETDFKYKKYLVTIIYNVVGDKNDCEECLNDTYLGAWNAMPPNMPESLKAFLCVIARRCAIKRYHKNSKKSVVPSEMTSSLTELESCLSEDDGMNEFDAEQLGHVISNFVRGLPERRQFIFISRYYVAEPIDKIAKDLNLSVSTVNKELASIRIALKQRLEREGYLI